MVFVIVNDISVCESLKLLFPSEASGPTVAFSEEFLAHPRAIVPCRQSSSSRGSLTIFGATVHPGLFDEFS
jgi:hypothetical protein